MFGSTPTAWMLLFCLGLGWVHSRTILPNKAEAKTNHAALRKLEESYYDYYSLVFQAMYKPKEQREEEKAKCEEMASEIQLGLKELTEEEQQHALVPMMKKDIPTDLLDADEVFIPWVVKITYLMIKEDPLRCMLGQVIYRSELRNDAKISCFFDNNLLIGEEEKSGVVEEESIDDDLTTTMTAELEMNPSTTEIPALDEEEKLGTTTQRSSSAISLTTTMSSLLDASTRSESEVSADKDDDSLLPAEDDKVHMNVETEAVHQPGHQVHNELIESVDTAAVDVVDLSEDQLYTGHPQQDDHEDHYDWEADYWYY